MAGIVLTVAFALDPQLRATQADLATVKSNNRQRIGYPGYAIPTAESTLPNSFFRLIDPVLYDGSVIGLALYAAAVGQLTVQRYRVAAGNTVFVGPPLTVDVPATGYQYLILPSPMSIAAGDYLAFKGNGIVPFSYDERADGSGALLQSPADGVALGTLATNGRFHIGFDIVGQTRTSATQRHLLTVRSSDKILWYRNSYIGGHYLLMGKGVSQAVADMSEFRAENFSIPGTGPQQLLQHFRDGDFSHLYGSLKEVNPTYIVAGEMTNAAINAVPMADYLNAFSQLIETSKSMGVGVIVGTEHLSLYNSGGIEVGPQAIWKLARDHGAIPVSVRENGNVFGPAFGGYGVDYAGWDNGLHPSTRYSDIITAAYLDLIERVLGRPDEGLRAFRPRPNADGSAPAIANMAALLFEPDDLQTRTALFREIDHAQGAINPANEQYVDRIDQITNNDTQTANYPSEYMAWQTGRTVAFTDYAYVEAILPANGRNVTGYGIYVSDPTVQVFVRDTLYTDLANPNYPAITLPTGAWRPLGIDPDGFARLSGEEIHGSVFSDKVCFLLAKPGAFVLAEPVVEWFGTRGKVKPPVRSSSRPRGATLVTNPYLANGGSLAAGWTGTGGPAFGTGLTTANMLPRGATADVRVTSSAKAYTDLTWTADQFHDREIEIEVWATGVRPLVDPTAAYPGSAAITRFTNDLETLVVEIIGGANSVPNWVAVPQYWRRTRLRTLVVAGSTGMRVQLSAAANTIAVAYAQATFVDA